MQGSAQTLTRIRLERFTAFGRLDLELTPGINVFIGANGTGKTHLLKVAYAACDAAKTGASVADKLARIFPGAGRSAMTTFREGELERVFGDAWRAEHFDRPGVGWPRESRRLTSSPKGETR